MRLIQILEVLKSEPLFSRAGYRETLLDIFQAHALMSKEEYKHSRTGKAKSGSELEVQQMSVKDGVAVIPIGGPIGQNLGEFEKGAGAVDVDDIAQELNEAEANDEVQNIVLDLDTPGGMVAGTPELGTKIAAVEKPIYAWSRGQIASAGYWLACSTDGIFCTPTASIGSIGVCMSFMDLSRMADMAGIKVKVIGSGTYKGMGTPGTSLTAQQEVYLQNSVSKLAQLFYDHVSARRAGRVAATDMQGQSFHGRDALEHGLVDGVMGDFSELLSFLKS